MPDRRLAARVFGMVGINVVIEQRAAAIVRFALRALLTERRDPRRDPVPGDRQQQALGRAVVLCAYRRKRREIHLSGWHMRGRQPGAEQIRARNKPGALTLRHRHHQTRVIVVQHQGELEYCFAVYRPCIRRRR